ncbi:hypothetical protein [Arsenophonus endosymbiont of Bemisia tabaci]|nr:hypothetical protein [Arsenophonus endosymbiont of Bemisia tabaci]
MSSHACGVLQAKNGELNQVILDNIAKRLNFDGIIYISYSIDFRRKVI